MAQESGTLFYFHLRESHVVIAHGEMHPHLTVAAGRNRSAFKHVLLYRSAGEAQSLMELQKSLGQSAVVKAGLGKQRFHDILVAVLLDKGIHAFTIILQTNHIQPAEKCEIFDPLEEETHEIIVGLIRIAVKESEEILEHAGSRAARRHEFHHLASCSEKLLPDRHARGLDRGGEQGNAVARGGRSFHLQHGETFRKHLEFALELLFSLSAACKRLAVFFG